MKRNTVTICGLVVVLLSIAGVMAGCGNKESSSTAKPSDTSTAANSATGNAATAQPTGNGNNPPPDVQTPDMIAKQAKNK